MISTGLAKLTITRGLSTLEINSTFFTSGNASRCLIASVILSILIGGTISSPISVMISGSFLKSVSSIFYRKKIARRFFHHWHLPLSSSYCGIYSPYFRGFRPWHLSGWRGFLTGLPLYNKLLVFQQLHDLAAHGHFSQLLFCISGNQIRLDNYFFSEFG